MARSVKLDFEIQEEAGGSLLGWSGPTREYCGDTWHPSLNDALEQARLWFGIEASQWSSV
jgi:hypothetical protein